MKAFTPSRIKYKPRFPRQTGAALLLLVTAGIAPASLACGYHDPSSIGLGMLNWSYPDALHVRTAVWMAQAEGLIEPRETFSDGDTPESRLRLMARMRATQRQLEALRIQVEAARHDPALPAFSVLLIGPMLWTRFAQDGSAVTTKLHTDGPASGDVVLVTDAPVIAALADERLTLQAARDRGLIRLYGEQGRVEHMAALLGGRN